MAKNKKWILAAVAVLAVVLCCWAAWSKWASTTRIGLVNFQNYQTASLVKSNEDNFIEYEEIPLDRLDRLGRYDLVLGFGMGLKITEEQRAQILAAADRLRISGLERSVMYGPLTTGTCSSASRSATRCASVP